MNVVFIGPQASGKGTQAKIVSKKLGLCHISTGDLLRGVKGDLKLKVDSYINHGRLVPDELILEILEKKLLGDDCKNGFILDGFPRTISQAEELDKITSIDKVVEISISDNLAVERLSSRLTCRQCGEIFNSVTNPPKENGKCDKCGGELYSREDDREEAIRARLEIYHKETEPILKKYDSVKVDGSKPIDEVLEEVMKVLEQ